ncbi:MAG: hypothetical protein WB611_07295 [Stellaceae bacterium]
MPVFFYGAFGAILPDVILFESKRFSAPLLTFNLVQYIVVTLLYMAAAGIVARVFPFRGGPTPWKAILVGISLPVIVSSATAAIDGAHAPEALSLRGPLTTEAAHDQVKLPGTLVDLMALF